MTNEKFNFKELSYKEIAEICYRADGGCDHCALQVAEGFKYYFPELDLNKLEEEIRKKI